MGRAGGARDGMALLDVAWSGRRGMGRRGRERLDTARLDAAGEERHGRGSSSPGVSRHGRLGMAGQGLTAIGGAAPARL